MAVGNAKTDICTLFTDIPKSGATQLPSSTSGHRPPTCRPSPASPRGLPQGSAAGVPLLTGTNKDEGDAFAPSCCSSAPPRGWKYKLLPRCLSDRATRKAALQRPDYLAPVRSTEKRMFSAGSPRTTGSLPETPTKGGTILERNIADIYVILDARGQAPSVHMRWQCA